jgi:hypothetical protein
MGVWIALVLVFIAGLVGGLINALISDNGFAMPTCVTQNGIGIWRPGYIGNMLIGGVAAAISWGLYGPAGAVSLVPLIPGSSAAANVGGESGVAKPPMVFLTMAGLVGGVLVGVGGARWLSNEVDKSLLRAAASEAALSGKNAELSATLAIVPPVQALEAAATHKKTGQ